MEIVVLILIFLALIAINYQLYYSFFMPEKERRRAFSNLTEEQIGALKQTLTAEHYFKLRADIQEPQFKKKK